MTKLESAVKTYCNYLRRKRRLDSCSSPRVKSLPKSSLKTAPPPKYVKSYSRIKLEIVKNGNPTGVGIGCPRERKSYPYGKIRGDMDEVRIILTNRRHGVQIKSGNYVGLEATCRGSHRNPYPSYKYMYSAAAGGIYYYTRFHDYSKG